MGKPQFSMQVSAPKLDKDGVRVELLRGLRESGKSVVKVFETTIASWEGDKPKFEPQISLTEADGAGLDIGLTGPALGIQKWFWLDEGTPPHTISAKPGGRLAFQSGYKAKTVPGLIGSGPGGPSGGTVFAQSVEHPGTEAREWSKAIAKAVKPIFKDDMRAALAAGLKRARKG